MHDVEKKYYADGEDAYDMRKNLKGSPSDDVACENALFDDDEAWLLEPAPIHKFHKPATSVMDDVDATLTLEAGGKYLYEMSSSSSTVREEGLWEEKPSVLKFKAEKRSVDGTEAVVKKGETPSLALKKDLYIKGRVIKYKNQTLNPVENPSTAVVKA